MQEGKHSKKILFIVIMAITVIVAGIGYLLLTTDPNAVIAQNDGYDIYRASLTESKAAFDNDEALFVDVRSEESFDKSHIPGAVVIPLSDIAGNEPPVDKGTLIYTYCT